MTSDEIIMQLEVESALLKSAIANFIALEKDTIERDHQERLHRLSVFESNFKVKYKSGEQDG